MATDWGRAGNPGLRVGARAAAAREDGLDRRPLRAADPRPRARWPGTARPVGRYAERVAARARGARPTAWSAASAPPASSTTSAGSGSPTRSVQQARPAHRRRVRRGSVRRPGLGPAASPPTRTSATIATCVRTAVHERIDGAGYPDGRASVTRSTLERRASSPSPAPARR